jgi:hypothetical protein
MTAAKIVTFLGLLASLATADIVFENEPIVASDVFDLKFALKSEIDENIRNATKYYCIFRSLWTEEDHPNHYPDLARYSTPVIFSHTKQYTPFLMNRDANYGVEILAEVCTSIYLSSCTVIEIQATLLTSFCLILSWSLQEGFTTKFKEQIQQAGEYVNDYQEGQGFYLNKQYQTKNFKWMPPVTVSSTYPFLSGLAGFDPSPDWFTGFYLMNTVDEYARTYWEQFKIQTYPWDAGTDGGLSYEDIDYELESPETVHRITPATSQSGVFVSPLGDEVLPVAEWECILHTCPTENPDCEKENFPPSNGCDIIRFPKCDTECDPTVDSPCERCKRESNQDPEEVFFTNCCEAGRVPRGGSCDGGSGANEVAGMISLVLAAVAAVLL